MKFLVVGCGSIGKRHLNNLRSLSAGELTAYDTQQERSEEVKQKYGVRAFSDFQEAMRQEPHVVLVCTPTSSHMEYALVAVRSGCHVFIEKPISHTMEGVDELIEIASSKNLLILVGCNFRFHWGLALVKKLMDEGKIGKVLSARAEFGQYLPDWHPWEDYRQGYSARKSLGGGIILDSIHELDYLYWLLGEVKEVYSVADKLSSLEIDVEDIAEIILRFDNGAIGRVHVDYIQRAYDRSLKLIGEDGTITWNFQDNSVKWYLAEDKRWEISQRDTPYDTNEMYIDEMKHFISCIKGEKQPLVDGSDGKRVLEIALATKRSSETKAPITL